MIFESINFCLKNDELLDVIEKNCYIARNARGEIKTAERLMYQNPSMNFLIEENNSKYEYTPVSSDDSDFEDAVACYLDDYLNIDLNFNEEDLVDILPSRNSLRYRDLLMRLIAESVREIKEYKELSLSSDISKDDLVEIKNYISCEEKKMNIIKNLIIREEKLDNEENDVLEEKNTLILVPTLSGNIRILSEIESIPVDYLPMFKDLFDSIIDGTFKNIKKFSRNSPLAGFYEVKRSGIRVVFKRISRRKYAIITAFIKRKTNDSGYRETLISKITDFNRIQEKLKEQINSDDFVKNNNLYVEELYRLLSDCEKNPEYIKGGN